MATVQQLEKLHHIQRLFYVDDSLEACVAGERVATTIKKTEQLIKQRAYLREERRRLRVSSEQLEDRKNALKTLNEKDWLPAHLKTTTDEKRIQLNIGGLMFECPVSILRRDPSSLLAQLTEDEPSILRDPEGFFAFDRDWWLFRYIMAFLRDGTLPEDRALLAQLYREASFWQLVELQRAIEEEKLHLRTNKSKHGDSSSASAEEKNKEEEEKKRWWRKMPSWQESVQKAEAETKEKSKKKTDWWTGTTYNNQDFLPLPAGVDGKSAGGKGGDSSSSKPSGGGESSKPAYTSATWFVPEDRGKARGEYGGSSGSGYRGGGGYTMEQVQKLTMPVTVDSQPGAGGGVLHPRMPYAV